MMSAEPTQTCKVCGRVVRVDRYARGFPPDAAKRKLIKLCAQDGHKADPQYRAGFIVGPPAQGMAAGAPVGPTTEDA